MASISLNSNPRIQSPYLYNQAVGSDGNADKCRPGIFTRWDLTDKLAEVHIPKGNLFTDRADASGFNKENDFIELYRAEYSNIPQIQIPFWSGTFYNNTTLALSNLVYLSGNAGFTFEVPHPDSSKPVIKVIIRFLDLPKAQVVMNTVANMPKVLDEFFKLYDSPFSIELENRLMYKFKLHYDLDQFDWPGFVTGRDRKIAIETVSIKNRYDLSSRQVIQRLIGEVFLVNGSASNSNNDWKDHEVIGENIQSIRINLYGGILPPEYLTVETYEDTFEALQENDAWQVIDNFSLTLDEGIAYQRLQGEPYNNSLKLDWNKFDTQTALNVDNYYQRWQGAKGLQQTIDDFISLSITDPRGIISVPVSSNPSDPKMTLSTLDMLKLASLDYHTARMMGLGYLDFDSSLSSSAQYIYAAVYRTTPLLPYVGSSADHIALTLPTGQTDQRFPIPPVLEEIEYGLEIKDQDNENSNQPFCDQNGYSLYDKTRFIKLNKTNHVISEPLEDIVPLDRPFDGTQVTSPCWFGIEYKNILDADWKNPKILNDPHYLDLQGINEPILIPETDNNPFFTHRENQEGVHEYAVYGVNWFNRFSGLSNSCPTDDTLFPIKNSLLPPFNLAVQYIQEEDPLIFTTQAEQDSLEFANQANPTNDNCKLRVCFEWDNINANAYQFGDTAEFFFRDSPPRKVEGNIKKVVEYSEEECIIETEGYVIASVSPSINIFPSIPTKEIPNFIDSFFCTAQGQFKIVAITQSNGTISGASFRVKKTKSLQAVQSNPEEPYTTMPIYFSPKVGDSFFVLENLNQTSQWKKLNQTVALLNFNSIPEEVFIEDSLNTFSSHQEYVGGITGLATIKHIPDAVTSQPETGGYEIAFSSAFLSPHPQSNVSWYKGSVRLSIQGKPTLKRLKVVTIKQLNPLKIVVFDPDYFIDPTNIIEVSTLANNNQTFKVNFHPGYKVYLSAESGTDFNRDHIVPTSTVNNKKTYFTVHSKDSTNGTISSLSNSATIVARNIQPPVTPMIPLAGAFATRPDFYSKSTYSFDIEFVSSNRTPYGAIVYRSSEMAILQALYKPATVLQILNDLKAVQATDTFVVNRWQGLLKVDNTIPNVPFPSTHNFSFLVYGDYAFPVPDNDQTEVLGSDAITITKPFNSSFGTSNNLTDYLRKVKQIKKAIEDIFIPVTETPLILEFIKNGSQTSGKKPTYKDIIGRLLDPLDPLFDPFPMTVRLSNNPYRIRFTDYTINGNAANTYFYFVKEVAINMKQSPRTDAIGPIYLVDTNPPIKPKIRSILAREESNTEAPAIIFDIATYMPSENISHIQIFRTTYFPDSTSTRTMNLAASLPFTGSSIIQDEFSDLEAPPFGQTLYYRIVALKKIINENAEVELVPSDPSELVYTNIFDVKNPISPVINPLYTPQPATATQVEGLSNCKLTWTRKKGCYNAIFRVLKMNSQGNWEKLWTKRSNQNLFEFPENNDFTHYPMMSFLPKTDDEGNPIYHRFKIEVENASGLLSGDENILIL